MIRSTPLVLLAAAAHMVLSTAAAAQGAAPPPSQKSQPMSPTPPAEAAKAQPADAGPPPAQGAAAAVDDPYQWLEPFASERADAWVKAENDRTTGVIEKDPRFAQNMADALRIAEARDRIPAPRLISGEVYNFWQDAEHVRGLWRKTTLAEYRKDAPAWTTVLDLDALAKAENANWVWQGANCLEPDEDRCLISLSDGGEDAVTIREFDLKTASFVDGGFTLPKGKMRVAWESRDALLVSREWTKGDLTASGYPYIVKRVTRGAPLERAVQVFSGDKRDGGYGVSPFTVSDGQGNKASFITRPLDTFNAEQFVVTPTGAKQLGIPLKVQVSDLIAGRLIFSLDESWTPAGGAPLPTGALAAADLKDVMANPAGIKPTLVYTPGKRESVQGATATKSRLLVTTLDNVRGRVWSLTPTATGWTKTRIALPDNVTVGVSAASTKDDTVFVSATGFLTPTTLSQVDATGGAPVQVKALPPKFDSTGLVVEQHEATSKDGTKVPYFVVHRKDAKLDGSNPTLLYAYGGFQVSQTPSYSGSTGKLWLEKGGVYAVANIRGGGEFGPDWHQAGLKTKRQVVYDDFAAVAEDLIARKITSPRKLGIRGGSNGGLLMGVQMTQRPDLYQAVIIDVPLLDMLRIGQIAAGASWQGEYGDPDTDPAVRAFWAKLSPYHALDRGKSYPEPFIFTTTKDDRVGPQHARKFAARLKEYGKPYYFYELVEGGHGAGANLRQQARTQALEMTYLQKKLMGDGAASAAAPTAAPTE